MIHGSFRQGDLFGHEGPDPSDEDFETPVYYPDPAKVREELNEDFGRGASREDNTVGFASRRALPYDISANDWVPAGG